MIDGQWAHVLGLVAVVLAGGGSARAALCGEGKQVLARFAVGRVVAKRLPDPPWPSQRSEKSFTLRQRVYSHARFPIVLEYPEKADAAVVHVGRHRFVFGTEHELGSSSPRRGEQISVS